MQPLKDSHHSDPRAFYVHNDPCSVVHITRCVSARQKSEVCLHSQVRLTLYFCVQMGVFAVSLSLSLHRTYEFVSFVRDKMKN